jgi:hypothetical protein
VNHHIQSLLADQQVSTLTQAAARRAQIREATPRRIRRVNSQPGTIAR